MDEYDGFTIWSLILAISIFRVHDYVRNTINDILILPVTKLIIMLYKCGGEIWDIIIATYSILSEI